MNKNGFTLIELMIVVVVIGIIAAIALPAYQNFVSQARRADAKESLLDLQMALEGWRMNNPTYTTDMTDLGYAGASNQASNNGFYTIDITSVASTASYTLQATPTGSQTGDSCGNFVVDENGPNYTGTNADADCWGK